MTIGRAKRNERFTVSLTFEEMRALEAKRAVAGFPNMSAYVRFLLLQGALRSENAEAA